LIAERSSSKGGVRNRVWTNRCTSASYCVIWVAWYPSPNLDVLAEWILHHPAVQILALGTANLDPEALLALVPGEPIGGWRDHLHRLPTYQADLIALIGER
jgi:hypothetical protein